MRRPAGGLFGGFAAAPFGASGVHLFGLCGLARLVLPARAGSLLFLSLLDLGIATCLGALRPASGLVLGFVHIEVLKLKLGDGALEQLLDVA